MLFKGKGPCAAPLPTPTGRVHTKQKRFGFCPPSNRLTPPCHPGYHSASLGSLTMLSYTFRSSLAQQDKHRKTRKIRHITVCCQDKRLTQHSMKVRLIQPSVLLPRIFSTVIPGLIHPASIHAYGLCLPSLHLSTTDPTFAKTPGGLATS